MIISKMEKEPLLNEYQKKRLEIIPQPASLRFSRQVPWGLPLHALEANRMHPYFGLSICHGDHHVFPTRNHCVSEFESVLMFSL